MSATYPAGILASHKTANAIVLTGVGKYWGLNGAPGTDTWTAEVFDGTDNTGATVARVGGIANMGFTAAMLTKPVDITTGLYIEFTGTATEGIVYYQTPIT